MKLLLITSLGLVVYLLRPIAGASPFDYVDSQTILWIAVSILAVSRMGGSQPASHRANRTLPNALNDSSFSGSFSRSSFLSPNNPTQ